MKHIKYCIYFQVLFYCLNIVASNGESLSSSYEKDRAFSLRIAQSVKPYFIEPYKEDSQFKLVAKLANDEEVTIYRWNHGLHHSMRKAMLAADILRAFYYAKPGVFDKYGENLAQWVRNKMRADPNFLKKVELVSAVERSGRQSEDSEQANPTGYKRYQQNDQQNFYEIKQRFFSDIDFDFEESKKFSDALIYDPSHSKVQDDVHFLSRILRAVHLFDLRRIQHFNGNIIKGNIANILFQKTFAANSTLPLLNDAEENFLETFWKRIGHYLKATGDRDLENKSIAWHDLELFAKLAHDEEALIASLYEARCRPDDTIYKAMLHHTRMIRAIKKQPSILNDKGLENTRYTASEAFLRIYLKEHYLEIPNGASFVDEENILRQNIRLFLEQKERFVFDSFGRNLGKFARVENIDDQYLDTLVKALIEERRHRDKIVLYHTTDTSSAFLSDLLTEVRQQIAMKGTSSLKILRGVDSAFLRLSNKFNIDQNKLTVEELLSWCTECNVSDSQHEYMRMCLSTNLGLFGSDQQNNSDSYFMFFQQNGPVTINPPCIEKLLALFAEESGINFSDKDIAKLKKYFDSVTRKSRTLLQIFIDPSEAEQLSYASVAFGYPLLGETTRISLTELIRLLRTDPESFFSRVPSLRHPAKKVMSLEDLQVRLFMRPDFMLSEKIIIKAYLRKEIDRKNQTKYRNFLQTCVDESLKNWILDGYAEIKGPSAFCCDTLCLPSWIKTVRKNLGHDETIFANEEPLESELSRLLINQQSLKAAELLLRHYDELKDKIFNVPGNEYSGPASRPATLIELCLHYYEQLDFIKGCFKAGIFVGGDFGARLFAHMEKEKLPFLSLTKNPSFTPALNLLENYFPNVGDFYNGYYLYDIVNLVINHANDEELVHSALFILKELPEFFPHEIFAGLSSINKDRYTFVVEKISQNRAIFLPKNKFRFDFFIRTLAALPEIKQNEIWQEVEKNTTSECSFEDLAKLLILLSKLEWNNNLIENNNDITEAVSEYEKIMLSDDRWAKFFIKDNHPFITKIPAYDHVLKSLQKIDFSSFFSSSAGKYFINKVLGNFSNMRLLPEVRYALDNFNDLDFMNASFDKRSTFIVKMILACLAELVMPFQE